MEPHPPHEHPHAPPAPANSRLAKAGPNARVVPIAEVPIRLGQFLKLAGAIGSGSDAKATLGLGDIEVNGVEERRRGRRLGRGDVVDVAGQLFVVG